MMQVLTSFLSAVCKSGNSLLEVVLAKGAAVVHHHEEAVAAGREHKVLQRCRPVIRVHHMAGRPGRHPLSSMFNRIVGI